MQRIQLATPVSHLFLDEAVGRLVAGASDCLECRDRTIDVDLPGQELFHCDVQPIHEFTPGILGYLEKIRAKKKDLKLVTFHVASNCDKPTIEDGMFVPGGRTFTRSEMLAYARENFATIRRIFGPGVEIGIENNNYYRTAAYDVVTDPDFITEVAETCDTRLLFDIAHARVSAHNLGIRYEDYKAGLPLGRAIQIHLCTPEVTASDRAVDAHKLPVEADVREALDVISKTDVRYLTVEYYKDSKILIDFLTALRERNEFQAH